MRPLTADAFQTLKRLVRARTGLTLPDYKRAFLERRWQSRLDAAGCDSFEAYCDRLERERRWGDDWRALIDLVITTDTTFYRNPEQLEALLTVLARADGASGPLRVWSAACATGEEPYTLAILAREQLGVARGAITILASDISEANLAVARRAVYGHRALYNVPLAIFRKYFRQEYGRYVLAADIRRAVAFRRINLYDAAQMRRMRGMDAVMCRNCLLHMDEEAQARVVAYLGDCVRPGGYLVLGALESLPAQSDAFCPLSVDQCVIYQRVGGAPCGS